MDATSTESSDYSLPAACRIKRRTEFLDLQKGGKKFSTRNFLMVVNRRADHSRIGVVVSRKVDKRSSRRNYIRRCIREVFRLNHREFRYPADVVVIARAGALGCSFAEIEAELLSCFRRHALLGAA